MNNILHLDDIHTYYGKSYIIQGLSLKVGMGAVVGLIGRNGMGKTTTIRSTIGFTPVSRGRVLFKGMDITSLPPFKKSQRGITIVPQGRRIFPSLSVQENLVIAEQRNREKLSWNIEKVFSLFPRLRERINNRGNDLSGGEQQMLAIARALVSNPDLILMDEPSEGLAPFIIRQVTGIIRQLKQSGLSILVAEQNIPMVLDVADYAYVVNKGKIALEGFPEELLNNEEARNEYLAI
jgi:branched-chain amino acid transport system ATP-binding protein